jgi:2-dehydro-3-deoxygluconokinase
MTNASAHNMKVITLGEVLLRLSTPGQARFAQAQSFTAHYGGSEANVAVSLAKFGISAAHVTRLPQHDIGKTAAAMLQSHGVDTRYIAFGDERMALYFFENGVMHRAPKIIYDRFNSAFSYIKAGVIDWNQIFADASWFHYSGITPAISQGAADVCLEAVEAARRAGLTISGDINYRRNLWQYGKSPADIMPSLLSMTDVVVGGIADFENCCGTTGTSYAEGCKNLQRKFQSVKKVAMVLREGESASSNFITGILWNGKTEVKSKRYELTHIVDRIGAGDAFMAGLIHSLHTTQPDDITIEFATAACAWKHSVEGDVNLATVEEVMRVARGENVGRLLR